MRGVAIQCTLPSGSASWAADRVQEMTAVLAGPHSEGEWHGRVDDQGNRTPYASRSFYSRGGSSTSLHACRAKHDLGFGETMKAYLMRSGTQTFSLEWTPPDTGAALARRTGRLQARGLLSTLVRLRDLLRKAAVTNFDQAAADDFAAIATVAASVAPMDANLYVIRGAGPWSPAGGICYDQSGRCLSMTPSAQKAFEKACGRMLRIEYRNGVYMAVAPEAFISDRSVSPIQAIRAMRRIGDLGADWWAETSNAA